MENIVDVIIANIEWKESGNGTGEATIGDYFLRYGYWGWELSIFGAGACLTWPCTSTVAEGNEGRTQDNKIACVNAYLKSCGILTVATGLSIP